MDQKELQEKLKNMSPEEIREFQKKQCIFCHIIEGKVPSKKIHEDDKCLAILDINPANPGHILLLPKEHYMIMPQVPEEIMNHLSIIAKQLSSVCLKAFKCDGTNVFIANGAAAGQVYPHFSLNIIPRFEDDDLNISLGEGKQDKQQLLKIKQIIDQKAKQMFDIRAPAEDIDSEIEDLEEEAGEVEKKLRKLAEEGNQELEEDKEEKEAEEQENEEKVNLDDIADMFN